MNSSYYGNMCIENKMKIYRLFESYLGIMNTLKMNTIIRRSLNVNCSEICAIITMQSWYFSDNIRCAICIYIYINMCVIIICKSCVLRLESSQDCSWETFKSYASHVKRGYKWVFRGVQSCCNIVIISLSYIIWYL